MMRSLSAALVTWVATEVKDLPHSIHPTVVDSCWCSSVVVLVCCFSMIYLHAGFMATAQVYNSCSSSF